MNSTHYRRMFTLVSPEGSSVVDNTFHYGVTWDLFIQLKKLISECNDSYTEMRNEGLHSCARIKRSYILNIYIFIHKQD